MEQNLVGRNVVITWAEATPDNPLFSIQDFKVISIGNGLIEVQPLRDGIATGNGTFYTPLNWILYIVAEPRPAPHAPVSGGERVTAFIPR